MSKERDLEKIIADGISKGIRDAKIEEQKSKGNILYTFGFIIVVFFLGTTAKPIFIKYLGIDPNTQYVTFWSTFFIFQLMSFLEAMSSATKGNVLKYFIKMLPITIVISLMSASIFEALFG